MPAAMLFWATLSDGYGGDACCDGYSLEFLNSDGCRNLLCCLAGLLRLKEALPLLFERFGTAAAMQVGRGENIRLLVLFEMVQCVLCAKNWVPASSSQDNDSLYEEVEIGSYCEPEPPCTMVEVQGTDVFDVPEEARRKTLCSSMGSLREFGWRKASVIVLVRWPGSMRVCSTSRRLHAGVGRARAHVQCVRIRGGGGHAEDGGDH